jgi:hypothetical protein
MAEPFKCRTLNMVAGQGYAIQLVDACATLSITARAECYVAARAPSSTPPVAPTTADAVPAAGMTTPYVHMLPGETADFGDATRAAVSDTGAPMDLLGYVVAYAVGSGNLTLTGH